MRFFAAMTIPIVKESMLNSKLFRLESQKKTRYSNTIGLMGGFQNFTCKKNKCFIFNNIRDTANPKSPTFAKYLTILKFLYLQEY